MKVAGMRKRSSSIIIATGLRAVRRAALRFGGILLGLLLMSTSEAHQQKNAVTRILFNENTGNIEVMRFFIHDAEHAAGLIFGERQMLAESRESRIIQQLCDQSFFN